MSETPISPSLEIDRSAPETVAATLLAVPFAGMPSPVVQRLDGRTNGRLAAAVREAKADPGATTVLHISPSDDVAAARIALVGVGPEGELDEDTIRTAAAAAARAVGGSGGALAWAFDDSLPIESGLQVRAVVEGAIMGAYDPGRWKTERRSSGANPIVLVGAPDELGEAAQRAAVIARWTNRARELVDGPPNEVTPAGLGEAATRLLAPVGVSVDVLETAGIERLGLGGLTAVGGGSANEPRLVVLRTGGEPTLGLVGKAITFDSGGFFLKGQNDLVKQKADMGGGAAVLAAIGAIAELGVRLPVLGVIPAAENMLGGRSFRPGDVVTTAAGLTVEITNPDAEGRLVLADGLWFAAREGVTRLVDVATLTGAMRGALGDLYIGVFANDDDWREQLVAAGNAAGDHAWPLPLHPRYRRLLDSPLADLRNTSGRSFGYPIIAAAFLSRFVGDLPWAHLDIQSTAYLDEERDYLARGATGAGVRLLVELASRLSARG